jgi:ParB-like chromosome segregation protein Spo0J
MGTQVETTAKLRPSDAVGGSGPGESASSLTLRFTPPPLLGQPSLIPEVVEVVDLVPDGSPRLGGLNAAHVERLTEAEWPLPPILVHRPTMRIIDGYHRVAAAMHMGIEQLDAYLLDGSAEAVFVIAVQANVTHGLPLSLAERRAAAVKILATHNEWSDRMIATSTGLSAKTVGRLRCANADDQQLDKRVGRDGRVRPLDRAEGRRRAAELLLTMPNASLRVVANAAGVSPGTVRDVRARLRRGDDAVPQSPARFDATPVNSDGRPLRTVPQFPQQADVDALLLTLSRDPALRMNEAGRTLLRWLHLHAVNTTVGATIAASTPHHCVPHIVELARACSSSWAEIARELAAHYDRIQRSTVASSTVTTLAR